MEGLLSILVYVIIIVVIAAAVFWFADQLPPPVAVIVKLGVAGICLVLLLYALLRHGGVAVP